MAGGKKLGGKIIGQVAVDRWQVACGPTVRGPIAINRQMVVKKS